LHNVTQSDNLSYPELPLKQPDKLRKSTHQTVLILKLAWSRFTQIDGTQRAGAFAYYAFFALFPLIILSVTIASRFINWERATRAVILFMQSYLVISDEMRQSILANISSVMKVHSQAGTIALLMLIWVAGNFFSTLISATNRAWAGNNYKWWQMPSRSLLLLGIAIGAVLLGVIVPMLTSIARSWLFPQLSRHMVYRISIYTFSTIIVFLCLLLFYKLAPLRKTRFAEVWIPALLVTILLKGGTSLFVIYLNRFSTLNAVYGTIGGIMAILLWIYICACLFIYGACLCAAQAELRSSVPQIPTRLKRKR
jgi:YihY family inner membrane protein